MQLSSVVDYLSSSSASYASLLVSFLVLAPLLLLFIPPPAIILSLLSPTSFLHLSDNLPHSPLLLSAPVLVFFSLSNHTFLLLLILHSPFSSFPLSHFFHFLNLLLALFFFLLHPVSLRRFRYY